MTSLPLESLEVVLRWEGLARCPRLVEDKSLEFRFILELAASPQLVASLSGLQQYIEDPQQDSIILLQPRSKSIPNVCGTSQSYLSPSSVCRCISPLDKYH